LNESWDGDVKDDIEMVLNRLIPEKLNYKHSCEGPDDMVTHILSNFSLLSFLSQKPAHAKHAILSGSNVTIPITDGRMNLGTWQGVWFIEHRNQKCRGQHLHLDASAFFSVVEDEKDGVAVNAWTE
uniref:Pecanex-like protein n=1 Tax=Hydatigena taeniaeformis TaxID=6205 RepID=A0A0R3XBU6_HYDTA